MFRFLTRHAACAWLVLVLPMAAAATFHPASPILPGPQVRAHMLPNGLTYYIQRNNTPAHRVAMRLVVRAGSLQEDDDQQGVAHFVEHMAFNGSTHFKDDELVSWLESVGMNNGADLNAETNFDETIYKLAVPSGRQEDIDKAFTTLEDWAHGVNFDAAALERQRKVVLEERRMRDGLGNRDNHAIWPTLFNGSRYPLRFPIGQEQVLLHAGAEPLRRFYRDWYRPDLMAVIVVGDIEPDEAERQIRDHFGALKNPRPERVRLVEAVKPLPGTRALVVTDRERANDGIGLNYPVHAAPSPATYGGFRDLEIEALFTSMMHRRLQALEQRPDAPLTAPYCAFDTPAPGQTRYATGGTVGASGRTAAIAALLQEQKRVREFGFTQDELDRVRSLRIGAIETAYNGRDREDSSDLVAEYTRAFLTGESISGRKHEVDMAHELLPGISLAEVNAFARKTLAADSGKLVILYGAERKDQAAPTTAQLLAETGAGENAPVEALAAKAIPASLIEHPPRPGGIVLETVDQALGVTRLTLSNGIRVILKPNPAHDTVQLWAQRDGGLSLFDEKDLPNARYATGVVEAMGLQGWSPAELVKILPSGGATVNFSINNYSDDINSLVSSSDVTVESMFQQLWLKFGPVRRDEGLYRAYVGTQSVWLRNRDAEPEARFADAFNDALYGKHPYAPRAMTMDDLGKLDLDRAIAAYRQRFSSARGFTFAIAGNFDTEKVKTWLRTWVATLPTGEVPRTWRDVGMRFAQGVVKKEVLAGTAPKSLVQLEFTGPAQWDDEDFVGIDALTAVLRIRINEVLRQQLGLVYASGVGYERLWEPARGYALTLTLPTGPEKVDQVVQAAFREIERMKTEGPTQDEVAKLHAAVGQNLAELQHNNIFWLSMLGWLPRRGYDPAELLRAQEGMKTIAAPAIREAARRFLDTGNYVQVVLNPEPPPSGQAGQPALAHAGAP